MDPGMYAEVIDVTHTIEDFSSFKMDTRIYTPVHSCGGFRWRLLIFPNGNRVDNVLSVYLDFVGPDIEAHRRKNGKADGELTNMSTAQASDAPLRTGSESCEHQGDGENHDIEHTGQEAGGQANRGSSSASQRISTVVEARVFFSVILPPPTVTVCDDSSSGIISTASPEWPDIDASCCSGGTFGNIAGGCRAQGNGEDGGTGGATKGGGGDRGGGGASSSGVTTTPAPESVMLKDCSHRFTEPDNDWGFRELIATPRAKRYVDGAGRLTLRARVLVYSQVYTRVRDRVMQATSAYACNWAEVVPLVQEHEELAANAPTRMGITEHNDGASLLHAACRAGEKDYAAFLLARGAALDAEDVNGRTALFYATRGGRKDVVEWLIADKTAAVNARDSDNRTALFYACEEGMRDLVQLLLEYGADTSISDNSGDIPAKIAEDRGHDDVAAMLRHVEQC